jgi:preprotein translocase subunit SecA
MTGTADRRRLSSTRYTGSKLWIPTNQHGAQRANDLVYLTIDEKYDAIVQDINERVLRADWCSSVLRRSNRRNDYQNSRSKIPHTFSMRNSTMRGRDCSGQPSRCVTIATNMAGRGTDIVLGGTGKWKSPR